MLDLIASCESVLSVGGHNFYREYNNSIHAVSPEGFTDRVTSTHYQTKMCKLAIPEIQRTALAEQAITGRLE